MKIFFCPENFKHQIKKLHAVNLHLKLNFIKLNIKAQDTRDPIPHADSPSPPWLGVMSQSITGKSCQQSRLLVKGLPKRKKTFLVSYLTSLKLGSQSTDI